MIAHTAWKDTKNAEMLNKYIDQTCVLTKCNKSVFTGWPPKEWCSYISTKR